MTNTEHIYTPQENSLSERIRAYCAVREAYLNAEASLKFLDDDEWADRLGDREDVEKAYEISVRSLHMATEAIKQDELNEAVSQDLLSLDNVREVMQHKLQQEMKSIRDGQKTSHFVKHEHK